MNYKDRKDLKVFLFLRGLGGLRGLLRLTTAFFGTVAHAPHGAPNDA